ncbi:MAG: hypothetical protein ACXWPS_07650 [Ktedonobacteraceae bacterium]
MTSQLKRAPSNGTIRSSYTCLRSSASAVIVVQSIQDREGEDLATLVIWRDRLTIPFWNLLLDALMRPGLIEVLVFIKNKVVDSQNKVVD